MSSMDTKESTSTIETRESGDGMEDSNRNEDKFVQPTKTAIEHNEELKLKAKFPGLKTRGGAGSALLQKRLHKGGQKYFDSGDYNMACAKLKNQKKPLNSSEKLLLQESIGDTIPTPENLPAVRKPSLVQSKLASGTLTR